MAEIAAHREVHPTHPEWKTQEPFASILQGDVCAALAGGERALVELSMATHAGMMTGEFERTVVEWIATAKHPMLELLAYTSA